MGKRVCSLSHFKLILWCSKQDFHINSPVPGKRKKEKTSNMKSFWYFGWKLQFYVSSWNCLLLSFYCLKRLMMVCDLWVDEWNLCLFSSNCILRPPSEWYLHHAPPPHRIALKQLLFDQTSHSMTFFKLTRSTFTFIMSFVSDLFVILFWPLQLCLQ